MQHLKMASPVGLTLLSEEVSWAHRGVDIVAVDGLISHSCFPPWTAKSSNGEGGKAIVWLRDWLPIDLPPARVFTYGYHSSTVCGDWGIGEAADKLLDELRSVRVDKVGVGLPHSRAE
ncbi:hypothetical protein F5Y19DRAFT_77445 [Xylariaceae sp. FL1651]|nr:hypothetical protein F5Y19DRAFT_77445 [Xylariaceae sp. FL1651]